MSSLESGDLLAEVRVAPPGPVSRSLSTELAELEAPVVNTLFQGEPSIVWQEALGSNVLDVDGNRYIDLTAGFGAAGIGHRHPQVVEALAQQSTTLLHGLSDVHAHPKRVELARRLKRLAPVDAAQVYYAISGADAVEIALQSMILSSGRSGILAFEPSYHGLTFGALAVTSRAHFRQPFEDWLPNTVHHLPWACPEEALEAELSRAPEIGGVIVEPVVGREGVIFPPGGWLAMVADVCKRNGVLLAVDEIFTGFGRTGTLWACDRDGVRPDLVCCGKILGGGVPIAAVLGRSEVMQAWDHGGEAIHTATFLANPLACAAGLAALDVIENDELVERSARLGRVAGEKLERLRREEGIVDVRGSGLLWGVEVDTGSRAAHAVRQCLMRGILLLGASENGNVIEICPPLTISEEQLESALDILHLTLTTGEEL